MKNIGSITNIYIALASAISSITEPDDNETVDVGFTSGNDFVELAFTKETASFSEEQQDSDAGPYFSQALTCRVPKISILQHIALKSLLDMELIIKFTDANGSSHIMGTLETPVRASLKMLRPADSAGYNGYEVTFRASCVNPAPFLDESFVVS